MTARTVRAPDVPRDFEAYQAWPPGVRDRIARYFLSAPGPGPKQCLILGCATGVNDALPLARILPAGGRILAGDLEPAFVERLQDQASSEGLANVRAQVLDVTGDLTGLGTFDLVSLLFVIHRVGAWEPAVDRLCGRVAPGGSLYISEFAGPDGIIYRSNEDGGGGTDPVSRLIRRYFELLPERFHPPIRSSWIGPVLRRLEGPLLPRGYEEFAWDQTITAREMLERIRHRAYAPYFSTNPSPELLGRLEQEGPGDRETPVALREMIRVYRFEKPGR